MRFKLLNTEIDEEIGNRIIRVHDTQENFTYMYYEDEIEGIDCRDLKLFIDEKKNKISTGEYDVPMP